MPNTNASTKVVTGNANKWAQGNHTGKVRFSYCNVFEPRVNDADPSAKPKYSVSLIIPKSDTKTIARIQKAIDAAIQNGISTKFGGKDISKRPTFHMPLRDGDAERPDDEVYKDSMFVNATSTTQPGIVDKDGNRITDQTEFYSGCYGFASVNFFPYSTNGSNGIACGLNNLQKLEDGDPLGGRSSAESDFDVDEDEDDF